MDLIINKIFTTTNTTHHGFNKAQFINLLKLILFENYFLFNNNLYLQTDGLAMGSPISATLANIFLCHYEEIWLDECPIEFKPHTYYRYVDDTFMLFHHESHIPLFLNYLNSKHNKIKFTNEIESNNKLSFLDVKVTRENNNFITDVYRKPTFTGLGLNFNSFTPIKYKINNIKCLLFRTYEICSSFSLLHKQIVFLKTYFVNNCYSSSIIENQIMKFLNKKYSSNLPVSKAPKNKIYIKFPYYGHLSFQIRKSIQTICNKYFPQLDIHIIFVNNYQIRSFFKFKDSVSDVLRSSLVYKYRCGCNATYVGMTSRHFHIRQSEHLGISYRTGIPLTQPPFSAIREHSNSNNHPIDLNNFSIIHQCNNTSDLYIAESILIKQLKPNLNNNIATELKIV